MGTLVSLCLFAVPAWGGSLADEAFDEVSALRAKGLYDSSEVVLRQVLATYPDSEPVRRRAYCELVFTLQQRSDTTGIGGVLTEALTLLPDLECDPDLVPSSVSDAIEATRKRMYGTMTFTTNPDSAEVYMDGKLVGYAPLTMKYIRPGGYAFELRKAGYLSYSMYWKVRAGAEWSWDVKMDRLPRWGWGPAAGVTLPVGRFADYGGTGLSLGASYWEEDWGILGMALRLEFRAAFAGREPAGRAASCLDDRAYRMDYRPSWLGGGVGLEYAYALGRFEPFVGPGAGVYWVWTELAPSGGSEHPSWSAASRWELGLNLSGGIRYYFARLVGIELGVHYDLVPGVDQVVLTGAGDELRPALKRTDLQALSITIGLCLGPSP
jgi:hypothetical protein